MLLLLPFLAASAAQPAGDTAMPAPGEWAWLNIPDAEGPGARFSYDTAVRRDGPRIELRLRYDVPDESRRHRGAWLPVRATIALDCAARTSRILRISLLPAHGRMADTTDAVPVALNTREAVLIHVLCPNHGRPPPADAPQ